MARRLRSRHHFGEHRNHQLDPLDPNLDLRQRPDGFPVMERRRYTERGHRRGHEPELQRLHSRWRQLWRHRLQRFLEQLNQRSTNIVRSQRDGVPVNVYLGGLRPADLSMNAQDEDSDRTSHKG